MGNRSTSTAFQEEATGMKTCPRCSTPQLANTLFCDVCGQEMDAPVEVRMSSLRCELPDTHQVLPLPQRTEMVLGRADRDSGTLPDVDLVPYGGREGGVSRQHCRLLYQHPHWMLEDLGSMNGTFLNGKRLNPYRPTVVQTGDAVRLGLLRMIFRAD